jgi:hypothetical protein
MGPIIWEQTRYKHDAYYCENNIITTNIIGCANNSSPIRSTTSGGASEEYLSASVDPIFDLPNLILSTVTF